MLRRLLKYQTIQTGKSHAEFKSFNGMPNKKKREENFMQVKQNFVRLYMSATFSPRNSFCDLYVQAIFLQSSQHDILDEDLSFQKQSPNSILLYKCAKNLSKTLESQLLSFFSNLKEFVCSFTKNELLCIYLSKLFFL